MPRDPKSQNPTIRRIESISGRSTWSSYRKNIYTLQALSISTKSQKRHRLLPKLGHQEDWEPEADPKASLSHQAILGNPPAAQGNSSRDLACPEDCLDHIPRESSTMAQGKAAGPDPTLFSDRFFPYGRSLTTKPQMNSIPNTPAIHQLSQTPKSCHSGDPQEPHCAQGTTNCSSCIPS